MIDPKQLQQNLAPYSALDKWSEIIPAQIESFFTCLQEPTDSYVKFLAALPKIEPSTMEFKSKVVIGTKEDCNEETREILQNLLKKFHPWRKGPYSLFGVNINTEWRSDWKWDRVKNHITPLRERTVLDVGCGNGYHCWRMWGEGAKLVIGIDPTLSFIAQYKAIERYIGNHSVHVIPLRMEDVPNNLEFFDTVFSMGILYHRRSPIDHLYQLKSCLHQGGELILETLVIDGAKGQTLVPEGRYAKMRNVWFIPTTLTLESWLKRCGFKNIRLVDVNQTSVEEQRATEWMTFESLKDFLSPGNSDLTVEGLPAPKRAIFVANK